MRKLYIKIITGFRKDQEYSIDAQEAHKAYYLFLNPEKRGIFNNGLAIKGEDIRSIEPDYNASMGWPPMYRFDEYDWDMIQKDKIMQKIRPIMEFAKLIAQNNPEKINTPLKEINGEVKNMFLE